LSTWRGQYQQVQQSEGIRGSNRGGALRWLVLQALSVYAPDVRPLLISFLAFVAVWSVPGAGFKVLVFSRTAAFRHASIPNGIAAIGQLGTQNDFNVVASENAADFTDTNLAQFRAVIFLSTTGDVLDAAQQSAFERYIRGGGGYVGIHAASDTEYDWPWYGGLVGAWFSSHPAIQRASVLVEDLEHPSSRFLPEAWVRNDEWYNFRSNPRANVHVLARLDESTYSGGTMGDHPIAWFHEYDGGRAWYTAGGHTPESYAEPLFVTHLLGGILYAANAISNPPPGALVLFNGRDTSHWTSSLSSNHMPWQVTNDTLTVVPGTSSIRTFQPFEEYLLHLEFLIPPSAPGTPENSLGNSGVYLQNQFEIQILDSYGRPVAGANETGAVWGQRDPSTNAARPAGTWETLDIDFQAAQWNGNVKIANARASVWWNGVLVQDNVAITGPTESGAPPERPPPGPIELQNLVGAVQFRNIWLLPRAIVPRGRPVELIQPGSTWRYLDDGSAPGVEWRANNFLDALWPLGRAQLGYGDGDEATVIRADRTNGTRIITTYFRKTFFATNIAAVTNLELRVLRDDGAIVYLNGVEVFRNNMPVGTVDSSTTAITAINGADEMRWISTNINRSVLVEGTNVFAVEIHQSGVSSTDVSFDLGLSALGFSPPDLSVDSSGSEVALNWPALPAGFKLEMTTSLLSNVWTAATNPAVTIPGVRSSVLVTNSGAGSRFFRLSGN
jgi:type 1 glutamine amidotransferase